MPRKHRLEPRTAADARKKETVTVTVAGAYGHGIDRPSRVIDTIEALYRRRQIDGRQRDAAETFRDAFDMLAGPLGGQMDFDKVKSGLPAGVPPAPAALIAAETLRHARQELGEIDAELVRLVAGAGYSIEQAAAGASSKAKLSERDFEYYGRRLRDALTSLANLWHPVALKTRIRSEISAGGKPTAGASGTHSVHVDVAHANGHVVRFSEREGGKTRGA